MAKLKLKNWQKNVQLVAGLSRSDGRGVAFHAAPTWEGGIPVCPEETRECVHYDGKRCQLTGSRPNFRCEPVIEQMAALLDAVEAEEG